MDGARCEQRPEPQNAPGAVVGQAVTLNQLAAQPTFEVEARPVFGSGHRYALFRTVNERERERERGRERRRAREGGREGWRGASFVMAAKKHIFLVGLR